VSASDEPTTYSFPTFHERSAELTAADISRIDIAAATRELIRTSFTSTASTEEIESAKVLLLQAIEILQSSNGGPGSAACESHFSDRSPFYGAMNPLSMPMSMERDDSVGEFGAVVGVATFTEPYEGPPGHVHGGFIAAAFDEVLGMAQSLTGRPGMTGRLTVTYRAPTPLHQPIRYCGWVDRVEGRKIFTKGTAHNGETLCAEVEGLFLSMPAELMDLLRKGRDLSSPPGEALTGVIEKGREN
jgi:acyl-coenzyme A thioesterase PaaI-like protein